MEKGVGYETADAMAILLRYGNLLPKNSRAQACLTGMSYSLKRV